MTCATCNCDLTGRNVWWHHGKPYCLRCTVDQLRGSK